MLQAGKSVTQLNDPLVKVQPEYLYHAVKNPKPDVAAAIRQLRAVRTIDENRYRQLKKQLPYVTCGIFNPPYRRTENFGWASHFILDIDHLSEKELDHAAVRAQLCADNRVKMLFCSPGEDGFKVLFQLQEKCYDAARYSLFYRVFAREFSNRHQLEQVIDSRTSDVTRACFVSVDPMAWFNPDAEPVNMAAFVDFENPFQAQELKRELQKEEKERKKEETVPAEQTDKGPDDEALAAIRARLNPSGRTKREKIIYVPDEMEKIVAGVVEQMSSFGIETGDIVNIHYGKKFRFRLQLKEAEINVFYGKRGFTIVQSPRRGTNAELNELCARILGELLL